MEVLQCTTVISHSRDATVVVLACHEALRRRRCLAGERLQARSQLLSREQVPMSRAQAISDHMLSRFRPHGSFHFTLHLHEQMIWRYILANVTASLPATSPTQSTTLPDLAINMRPPTPLHTTDTPRAKPPIQPWYA